MLIAGFILMHAATIVQDVGKQNAVDLLRLPAPVLGERAEYICREILGVSDEEFVELFSAVCLSG